MGQTIEGLATRARGGRKAGTGTRCPGAKDAWNSGASPRFSLRADLPTAVQNASSGRDGATGAESAAPAQLGPVLPLELLEKQAILEAVAFTHGDRGRAAAMLGIGRTTLYRKLKSYGVNQ